MPRRIDSTTELYGLIGMNIGYSLSPIIHNYLFEKLGINAVYLTFDVIEEKFEVGFKGLLEVARGLNVTIPYKERAADLIDELDPTTRKIGAVNTIHAKTGYNTDYLAVKQLVAERVGRLDGMKCLIIGAGGAAKASSFALAELGGEIYIVNRTRKRAEVLAKRLVDEGYNAHAVDDFDVRPNVLLNAVPNSSYALPYCSWDTLVLVIDLVYTPVNTVIIRQSMDRGVATINGLEVLVRQALLSQSIWQGSDLLYLEEEVMNYLCQETRSVKC